MEYKFESQKAIICFTLATVTLIGFVTAMVVQEYYVFAGIFGFIIFVFSILFYKKIKKRLDDILIEIENLEVSKKK